jgi:TRAP-type C4-dicarboxylate transport system substrate-binding protein
MKKLILATSALCLATLANAGAEEFDITIVAGHPPIFIWVKNLSETFIPTVNKELEGSGHTINWNEAYGGSLAKVGGESDAVASGLAQLAYNPTLFNPALFPLQNIAYVAPFNSNDPRLTTRIVEALQEKFPAMKAAWQDNGQVYLGGGFAIDSYQIFTTFALEKVADLEGRKICAPGPAVNWVKGTGAVPVSSSLTEYYNSIQTGICEGAINFATAAAPGGLAEVAPHMTIVDFGAPYAAALSANVDFYESLPDVVKSALHTGAEAYSNAVFADQDESIEKAYDKIRADGGIVSKLDEVERAKWVNALPNVPLEWASQQNAAGLPGTEVLAAFMNALREAGQNPPRAWEKE